MTTYNKWDTVLVRYPFSDSASEQQRPALIVSPAPYNDNGRFVILFVSGNEGEIEEGLDYRLKNWKDAGLVKASYVRMKFATITSGVIKKKLGHLSEEDISHLKNIF